MACQAGWFVCVMSAARGHGWLGVVFAAAMVALHLAVSARPAREARLVATVMLAGWLWDSAVAKSGLLVYPNGVLIAGTAPYWMAALWALFAIQLNVLFRWLRVRPISSACLGAAAGPLSFRAGAALGAVHFTDSGAALVTLAVGWALLLPACIALARRWDGVRID
ncbi:DUF2878 domain-containing protein [Burkholderia alba]|uniref:DUF2878 domain-containing protein n=1 Tax=Burkholderia alba TaxID=2683677 RepID=UPI002B05B599|nr:DUF2878 domain-containing protein [Burkholderia alba]